MPQDPGDTASQAIVVDSLAKKFGRREVLHSISFGIGKGSDFGVIGPNGAGKTTVMRCLLDIIRPTAGTSTVLGENPRTAGPALRRRIGYNWAYGNNPLATGADWSAAGWLWGISAALVALSAVALGRRDVGI